MANALYPTALKKFLDGEIDLLDDTIKIVLLDADASYSASDEFLDDVNTDAVATSGVLASKTTTAGAFDATDVTFTALTGAVCESWVLYKDTGTASTSPLIMWMDTKADTSAFSYTPNGSNFTINFGAGGVFGL